MTGRPALVADPELVTPRWLTEVLRHAGAVGEGTAVTGFATTSIGTGQVGANIRFALDYDAGGPPGPATVVCKFASRDPQSAAAGVSTGTYETEVAFYRDLTDHVDISRPRCYFADLEPGTANVVLVMEDLAPAEPGDQIAGCGLDQATLAVDEAARLHGPRWGDPTLGELAWLARGAAEGMAAMIGVFWGMFADRYGDRLTPEVREAGPQLATLLPKLTTDLASAPQAPVHGDYRLDNMLFATAAGGRPLTVVDWQTVRLGAGPHDVAYFLGSAFEPEARRACERDLVARYHRALVDDYGVDDYPFDQCWHDYVRSGYACLAMAVVSSMLVGQTDRGDAMFMAMASRSARMGADHDTPAAITT
jgi:hypothetical protein